MRYWLMKSEPTTFSVDDLATRPEQTEPWDGVRNYQARNFMRDQMHPGDRVFFYHSNCATPGIVGVAHISSAAYPDPSQFNPNSRYYDPASNEEKPKWVMVNVCLDRRLKRILSLPELRQHATQLDGLALLKRGSRLSIMPVEPAHWKYILGLE